MSLARKYTTKIEIWQPTEACRWLTVVIPLPKLCRRKPLGGARKWRRPKFQQPGLNDLKTQPSFQSVVKTTPHFGNSFYHLQRKKAPDKSD